VPPPARSKYSDDSDTFEIEDGTGRISVSDKGFNIGEHVSGIVVALLGQCDEAGDFVVEDVCYHDLAQQAPIPAIAPADESYVVLVSGFNLHPTNQAAMLPLQLFSDYIAGQLGGAEEQELVSRIARVVVGGNLVAGEEDDMSADGMGVRLEVEVALQNVRDVDDMLAHLSASVNVDIMPGPNDPSNVTVPQQPLHHCMFPRAASKATLTGVTNPYHFTVNGVEFLGTSGQGVDDIYRYSTLEDRMDILEKTLNWGHLFPSAPDTLACFPFIKTDPFIISECPHVYFAANQPEFATKQKVGDSGQKVTMVCVPEFESTRTVVLLNLRTLEATPVSFEGF